MNFRESKKHLDERRSKITFRQEDSDDSIEEHSEIRVFSSKNIDQVKALDTKKQYISKPIKSPPKEDFKLQNTSSEKSSQKTAENFKTDSLPQLEEIVVNTDLIPTNIDLSKTKEHRDDCDSSREKVINVKSSKSAENIAETKEKRVTFQVENKGSDLESPTKEDRDNLEAFESNLAPPLNETPETEHLEVKCTEGPEVEKDDTCKETFGPPGNPEYKRPIFWYLQITRFRITAIHIQSSTRQKLTLY